MDVKLMFLGLSMQVLCEFTKCVVREKGIFFGLGSRQLKLPRSHTRVSRTGLVTDACIAPRTKITLSSATKRQAII